MRETRPGPTTGQELAAAPPGVSENRALSTCCSAVCERHPELAALFESETGQIALLLTHTALPLSCERDAWLRDTRHVAREVIADLRAAGVTSPCLVLQWQPLPRVASVLGTWACRWDGRPGRRETLSRIARRELTDAEFLARDRLTRRRGAERDKGPGMVSSHVQPGPPLDWPALLEWYRSMAPTWLAVHPPPRRRLLLMTHLWVTRYVLAPWSRAGKVAAADLPDQSGLAPMLLRSMGRRERHTWLSWVDIVVANLGIALAWSAERRKGEWAKWLFLIPYGVPVPASARMAAAPGSRVCLEQIPDPPLAASPRRPLGRVETSLPTRRTETVERRA